jgi:hypothetical protein
VTTVLLCSYLGGWVLASILVSVMTLQLQDDQSPAPHRRWMSVAAGAVWPVLLLAIAEVGAVALATEAFQQDEQLLTIDA